MKTITILALQLLSIASINAGALYGNLAFYGRGHRRLPRYWSELKNVKTKGGAIAYFPYTEADSETDATATTSQAEGEQVSSDNAVNYPLNIYFPGKSSKVEYSEIRFEADRQENIIDIREYATLKAEMKFRPPPVDKMIEEGYTCESIGLTCTDLKSYDFDANKDEWLSKVDYKIYFEDPVKMESDDFSPEEKVDFQYYFDTFPKPTNEWTESVGKIGDMDFNSVFTSFIMRNEGTMPVYLSIGNSMFLKSKDTAMLSSGEYQNGFDDWSWGNRTTTTFPDDPNGEKALYFFTDVDGGCACYISVTTYSVGFSAPSEAISFRIHPIEDTKYHFRVAHSDNSYWLKNLTDWLLERNCVIPNNKESTVLVDVRSVMYLDAKRMLKNEVSGFWVQSISEINNIKARIVNETGDQAKADAYIDSFYLYDYTLHHTYPTDLSKYKINTYDASKPECDLAIHNHADWADAPNQWPDDISYEEMFKSKNVAPSSSIDDPHLNESTAVTSATATQTTTTAKATTTQAPPDDKDDGAMSNKSFSMSLLFVILSFFTLFF